MSPWDRSYLLGGALSNKTIVPSDTAITGVGSVPHISKLLQKFSGSCKPFSFYNFLELSDFRKNCTSDPSFIIKDTTRRGSQIGARHMLCGIRTHHVPSTFCVFSGTCPEPSQGLEIFFLTLKYNYFSALLSFLANPPIYASQLCFIHGLFLHYYCIHIYVYRYIFPNRTCSI